jgi:hypothetical protein
MIFDYIVNNGSLVLFFVFFTKECVIFIDIHQMSFKNKITLLQHYFMATERNCTQCVCMIFHVLTVAVETPKVKYGVD